VSNTALKIDRSWPASNDEALLIRALELSGLTLLVCSAALGVIASQGATEGLIVNRALEPALAAKARALLASGRPGSSHELHGFRLLRVEKNAEQQVLLWLRQAPTGQAAFGRLLRERYGFKLRSQQLLVLLEQGLGNREIARQLGLRETTVKTYLHEVYETLGVRSRTAALAELRRALSFDRLGTP
jgi:DNA-binding NarL/FixJ family response regulator